MVKLPLFFCSFEKKITNAPYSSLTRFKTRYATVNHRHHFPDPVTAHRRTWLPAALRAAQICRYLVYSEADFEVFRSAGATRCTDGGEIWHGGGDRSLLHAKFHPHRCNDKGVGPPKLKFLLRFDQNVEYKRPAGAYPLRDFHKICRVCTSFQDALGVKIWLDLLKGLWSNGGFKLRGSGFPQIFSAP